MSAIPRASTPNPHTNLLNVYIQIANKMGFKKNFLLPTSWGGGGHYATSRKEAGSIPYEGNAFFHFT
jgi:hypothetical protein